MTEPAAGPWTEYEVLPDAQAEQSSKRRANEKTSWILSAVFLSAIPDPDEADRQRSSSPIGLGRALKRQVPDYWRELRAAETLLDEAAEIFGEDPRYRRSARSSLATRGTGLPPRDVEDGISARDRLNEPDEEELKICAR